MENKEMYQGFLNSIKEYTQLDSSLPSIFLKTELTEFERKDLEHKAREILINRLRLFFGYNGI